MQEASVGKIVRVHRAHKPAQIVRIEDKVWVVRYLDGHEERVDKDNLLDWPEIIPYAWTRQFTLPIPENQFHRVAAVVLVG